MDVLLDTQVLAPELRLDAIRDGLAVAARATWTDITPDAHASLTSFPIGDEMRIIDFTVHAQRLGMRNVVAQSREASPAFLSIAVNRGDRCRTTSRGHTHADNTKLYPVDTTADYEIHYAGRCRTVALEVDYTRIGQSVDLVGATIEHVGNSPLSDLLRRQVIELARVGPQLSSEALALAGSGTADLVRAAILSVSPRDHHRREALAETLRARVDSFIRRNLADPDLTPARIAEAHNISLRYLYVLLEGRAETPAEWIMRQRLEEARADVALRRGSVSTIAHRWGFKDHSHFTRRFKAAYAVTPTVYALQADETVTTRPDDAARPDRGGRTRDEQEGR